MKERPILFSGEMVRAILSRRKAQTRRIMKPQPVDSEWQVYPGLSVPIDSADDYAPWSAGDVLWVREAFTVGWPAIDGCVQRCDEDGRPLPQHVWYRASGTADGWTSDRGAKIQAWMDEDDGLRDRIAWKPSIHMPRWASRITLLVESVRVERLQDISETEAIAEGIREWTKDGKLCKYWGGDPIDGPHKCEWKDLPCSPVNAYASLWESINGPGSWASNPWVWVVSFSVKEVRK